MLRNRWIKIVIFHELIYDVQNKKVPFDGTIFDEPSLMKLVKNG